jgi:P-type Cu2+ transporter
MEQPIVLSQPKIFQSLIGMEELEGYEHLVRINDQGEQSLELYVDGVNCAGCIQKIESKLVSDPRISKARLNFSTKRLTINWQGTEDFANDAVRMVTDLGYTTRPFTSYADHEENIAQDRSLLIALAVAGFATGNIMLLSVSLWTTTAASMGLETREFLHWMSALIAIPTIAYAGMPFYRSAFAALSSGRTNMDVPISVGVILTTGMSLFETMHQAEHTYFDSAVMLLFFLLIGRYLDARARRQARGAATDLLSTLSGFADVITDGTVQRLLIRDLRPGMVVQVTAGEKFPIDGQIISGSTQVDTSLITGETLPREIGIGAEVYAGTFNLSAPVTLRVAKAAEDSLLADIVRLMEKAGQAQALYVRLADRTARFYTPVVHIVALGGFLFWWGFMAVGWHQALMISVAVLIITCPCALGLAVPVVQVIATGRLMKGGVLVKSGDALERLASIDTVIFDKTGTLTLGQPVLDRPLADRKTWAIAAALAAASHHPMARGMAKSYHGDLPLVTDVHEWQGQGVEGNVEGVSVKLGSRSWCGDITASATGHSELWLRIGQQQPVVMTFSDRLRDDAASIVGELQNHGLNIVMLSGDLPDIVAKIAGQVGIKNYQASMKPADKFAIIENLRIQGHRVLMVGDGLNDAPSLARANVAIAPGTAIDMAQNAADIVFMGDKLHPIVTTWKIARLSQKLVRDNFILAMLYNVLAVPLALAGFVTPWMAALAMSSSSIIVIANSFRLRGIK